MDAMQALSQQDVADGEGYLAEIGYNFTPRVTRPQGEPYTLECYECKRRIHPAFESHSYGAKPKPGEKKAPIFFPGAEVKPGDEMVCRCRLCDIYRPGNELAPREGGDKKGKAGDKDKDEEEPVSEYMDLHAGADPTAVQVTGLSNDMDEMMTGGYSKEKLEAAWARAKRARAKAEAALKVKAEAAKKAAAAVIAGALAGAQPPAKK